MSISLTPMSCCHTINGQRQDWRPECVQPPPPPGKLAAQLKQPFGLSSRILWLPPQYQAVDLHIVLMIFETSVLMHFGYALKIPEQFISKMVLFTGLMQNVPFTNQVLQCVSQIPQPTLKGRGQIMSTQQVNMNRAKF